MKVEEYKSLSKVLKVEKDLKKKRKEKTETLVSLNELSIDNSYNINLIVVFSNLF